MAFQNYRDLELWQVAMTLVRDVYKAIQHFPSDERYALSDQIRRAVVSIPSNIAEGHGRDTIKEFLHFLSIARGSLYELQTQLEIARDLSYISDDAYSTLFLQMTRVDKMIYSLSKYLKQAAGR